MPTERVKAIARALSGTIPLVPFLDAEAIRTAAAAPHLRSVRPEQAFWLAAIAHIRHQHTDYDALRDEGYAIDEARFFVLDEINAVLDRWGSRRRLVSREDEDEQESEG